MSIIQPRKKVAQSTQSAQIAHAQIARSRHILAVILLGILSCLMSACNSFGASETTFILEYPPPRLESVQIDPIVLDLENEEEISNIVTISGVISTTLNPSVNDDFREYWLLLSSNTTGDFSQSNTGIVNDINTLMAEREDPLYVPHWFTNLTDVTNSFAQSTVNDYLFTNIPLTNVQFGNASPRDAFYELVIRAWGTNDSFALANENNGWILSGPSNPVIFYVGESIDCPISIPAVNLVNRTFGYTHPGINAGLGDCNQLVSDSADRVELLENDVIFYMGETGFFASLRSTHEEAGILKARLSVPGEVFQLPTLEEDSYITGEEAIPINTGDIFLIRHGMNRYSKFQFMEFTAATSESDSSTGTLRIFYTGTNWENRMPPFEFF